MAEKIVYSGIQPSGMMTLGNYVGAMKNWRTMQSDPQKRCIFALADLHTITVRQEPSALHRNTLSFMALCLAVGIDKDKSLLYIQSHVSQHSELAWLLNCYTYIGEMSRMTQFKDKAAAHADNVNIGLMAYPVLMAADILLYDTELVPVGHDQIQHLEIARDIARRCNGIYGDVFTVPEAYVPKVGARIMSLQEPTKKMSKSDPNPNAVIGVLDTPEAIVSKFKRAVTDSDTQVRYDPDAKAGVSNLLEILAAVTESSIEDAARDCADMMYGALKMHVADAVVETLRPVKAAYDDLMTDESYLLAVAREGKQRAEEKAEPTLRRFKSAIGFVVD